MAEENLESGDVELIAAVLAGRPECFEPLIVRYQSRVFRLVRRYARRETDVEDLAQEVFIRAYHKLKTFRGTAPFEHWLMRLAVRVCYDYLRNHQRRRETS
ncbi:MAG TPA: sigma-70 family RNA polymerase sigma factor [Verrucomicrobiota bacterium]|nr:sigma-70 family RNA polymerase sigma factor [Verrucomicrobiota bacterium]